MGLVKIISGGQTGVDRGALLAARNLDFPYGGWYPKGSLCEDSIDLASEFPLMNEHVEAAYPPRTEANVKDSQATLVIYEAYKPMGRGTKLTIALARKHNRFLIELAADGERTLTEVALDLQQQLHEEFAQQAYVLNVAGPRGSGWPAGEELTRKLVERLIRLELND